MKPRRAFTMIEVLTWLLMLSIVAVTATRLLHTTAMALQSHQLSLWEHDGRESLIAQIRQDTWTAKDLHSTDSTDLSLSDGIRYRISGQTISRTDAAGREYHWQLADPPRFQVTGPLVHLTFPAGRQWTFASAVALTKEAH